MNKPSLILACAAAFIGMGIAMPQCPGEKGMQDQIDGLHQSQQAITTKLMNVDSENKALQADAAQTKQLLSQLASAVIAQKDAIDRINVVMKDLQTKVTQMEKRPSSRSKSKSRSKRHR